MRQIPSDAFRRISRNLALSNERFDVCLDTLLGPNGQQVNDFLIIRPKAMVDGGTVGVLVLPELNGKVGVMKSYKHQLDEVVWQAPSGFVEPGEAALSAARRELVEEIGLTGPTVSMTSLGTQPDPDRSASPRSKRIAKPIANWAWVNWHGWPRTTCWKLPARRAGSAVRRRWRYSDTLCARARLWRPPDSGMRAAHVPIRQTGRQDARRHGAPEYSARLPR